MFSYWMVRYLFWDTFCLSAFLPVSFKLLRLLFFFLKLALELEIDLRCSYDFYWSSWEYKLFCELILWWILLFYLVIYLSLFFLILYLELRIFYLLCSINSWLNVRGSIDFCYFSLLMKGINDFFWYFSFFNLFDICGSLLLSGNFASINNYN